MFTFVIVCIGLAAALLVGINIGRKLGREEGRNDAYDDVWDRIVSWADGHPYEFRNREGSWFKLTVSSLPQKNDEDDEDSDSFSLGG